MRFVICSLAALLFTNFQSIEARERWTEAEAQSWSERSPWLVGCNYMPAYAINQLEMFQVDTFDEAALDRELGYAERLGFNSLRVFMHDLLWEQDSAAYLQRMDRFLALAEKHGIGVLVVFFDSCWHPVPALGKQPEPLPHKHNPGWLQSPGAKKLADASTHAGLKSYVTEFVRHYAKDRRIHGWDVWNEPDNGNMGVALKQPLEPKNKRELVEQLLPQVFEWVRAAEPMQPVTSALRIGTWKGKDQLSLIQKIQLEQSDVISFHNYRGEAAFTKHMKEMLSYGRPVWCTEYMARPFKCTFDPHLGVMKQNRVGAYCWGMVSGKSQTIYAWDSWEKEYTSPPELWFHDVFHPDGTPYIQAEADYIRSLTGAK
jgi:Cellulase (glycosyl hydrolase family 5)